ncbi:MAG TPA: PDZ domain-containing protein [Nannocystis exedens]|nr:PDZ domain-containing protein [Nannocystis exedens]
MYCGSVCIEFGEDPLWCSQAGRMATMTAAAGRSKVYVWVLVAVVAAGLGIWAWSGSGGGSKAVTEGSADKESKEVRAPTGRSVQPLPGHRTSDPWRAPRAAATGVVRDEQGTPIAGAQVCSHLADPTVAKAAYLPPICQATGVDGRYNLGGMLGARQRLSAAARGYLPARYQPRMGVQNIAMSSVKLFAGQTREGVDFILKRGGFEVLGVVKDISGGEIEGAYIWNRGSDAWFGGAVGGDSFTRSAADGRFSLWLAADKGSQIEAFSEGYTGGQRQVLVPGTFVEIFLTPESVIVGKVVRADSGEAVADVKVSLVDRFASTPSTYSAGDGGFRLSGLQPGAYKLKAVGVDSTGLSDGRVMLGFAETSEPVVLRVHPAYSVQGVVLIDGETPCSFATVRFKDSSRRDDWGLRNVGQEDGRVEVHGLLPGVYNVSVECADYISEEKYPDLIIEDRAAENLVWSVHPGQSISGIVVDAAGEAAANVTLYAGMKSGEQATQMTSGSVKSEADGKFTVKGLLPGTYKLHAMSEDYPEGEALEVELVADRELSGIVVELPAGGQITGVVRDERGDPVGGISVRGKGQGWISGGVDDSGHFALTNIAAGDYRIFATRDSQRLRAPGASDDDAAGQRVSVHVGETTEIELVVGSQSGQISGRVLAEGGEPIVDAFIDLRRESDSAAASGGGAPRRNPWGSWDHQPVLTDAEGRFELTKLAEEATYTIFASRKSGGEGVIEGVRAGSEIELVIQSTGSLSGIVTLEGGGVPERFEVTVSDDAQVIHEWDSFFRSEGQWTIGNLPPGNYEVSVRAIMGNSTLANKALLPEGGEVRGLELVLQPRLTIRGRLVDAESGEPVAGMKVSIDTDAWAHYGEPLGDGKDVSDQQGRFVVEGVPSGPVNIMVVGDMSEEKYDMAPIPRRLSATPTEQDLGDLQLVGRRVERSQKLGDLGFKHKRFTAETKPEERRPKVAFVRAGGPAAAAGLKVGDQIVKIDGQPVTGADFYRYRMLLRVSPGAQVKLELASGRELLLVAGEPL